MYSFFLFIGFFLFLAGCVFWLYDEYKLKKSKNNISDTVFSDINNQVQKLNGEICIKKNLNFQKQKMEIYITKKGEEVKSQGELRIANFLYDQKIDYIYEKPVQYQKYEIKPDFFLPKYDIYIEYWGGLGEAEYNKSIYWKKTIYDNMHLKVLDLYPNNYKKMGTILAKRFEEITRQTFPQRKFFAYGKE